MKRNSNKKFIIRALNFLTTGQDYLKYGAIPKKYILNKGWTNEGYKEVSGYIIPTFINVYKKFKDKSFLFRAKKIAEWEIKVQNKNGLWDYVFDTGQVILGLTSIYKETKSIVYIKSAEKAANFLEKIQESDGSWKKHIFIGNIKNKIKSIFNMLNHSYNSRTAYSLINIGKILDESHYIKAGEKNINLVILKQHKNGFYSDAPVLTHFLGYVAQGVIDSGLSLQNKRYISSAKKFIDFIIPYIDRNGFLPGKIYPNGKYDDSFSCLTGNAQISEVLLKIYKFYKKDEYLHAAIKLNSFLKKRQIKSNNPNTDGAIPGSYPINGHYDPNCLLPWATKFFIDSLILEDELTNI